LLARVVVVVVVVGGLVGRGSSWSSSWSSSWGRDGIVFGGIFFWNAPIGQPGAVGHCSVLAAVGADLQGLWQATWYLNVGLPLQSPSKIHSFWISGLRLSLPSIYKRHIHTHAPSQE
jgi:hypothetical protein